MTLIFLGTRGYIDAAKPRHRMHTATLVLYRGRRLLIDCGETWRGRLNEICPDAILVTHAHPDHVAGLDRGSPCPVFATRETWDLMMRFPIERRLRRLVQPRKKLRSAGIGFEAFAVVHSVRAPAVGYRISAGSKRIFYVPDVVEIPERRAALAGIDAYVGDGASIVRPITRRSKQDGGTRIGHVPVATQLDWCRAEGVPRMIVTHCGSAIVRADERRVRSKLRAMGRERGVDVLLAFDGMRYEVGGSAA